MSSFPTKGVPEPVQKCGAHQRSGEQGQEAHADEQGHEPEEQLQLGDRAQERVQVVHAAGRGLEVADHARLPAPHHRLLSQRAHLVQQVRALQRVHPHAGRDPRAVRLPPERPQDLHGAGGS